MTDSTPETTAPPADETRAAAKAAASARAARLSTLPLEQIGPRGGFFTGPIHALRDLFDHRELLDLLIRREIKARYKDSALGLIWTLAKPLTQLLIYYLVLGQFLGAARSIQSFAVYIFAGLTAYGLFSEIVIMATSSIVVSAGLVKKVYLPREIFPVASFGSALFNFSIQLGILVIASLLTGQLVPGLHLLYLPVAIAIVVVYALALGIALAAVNVYARDMQYLIEIVVMLLMWFSPIVYSWTFVVKEASAWGMPWLADLYLHTPLTLAVLGFQAAFWWPGSVATVASLNRQDFPPDFGFTNFPPGLGTSMLVCLLIGVVLLWLAQRLFARLEGNFAQEL